MNAPAATYARIAPALAGLQVQDVPAPDATARIEAQRDELLELATRLRDRLGFESVTFVTAIDLYPERPRYLLAQQFLSIAHRDRLRVHCILPEGEPRAPSITPVYPGASYFERECYDMFGIRFDGHPDLRRLLMPEGYEHHPLRKDFPHQGIEPDRLYREWDRRRRAPVGGER